LVDPKGYTEFYGDSEQIRIFEISYQQLIDFRKKFPVLNDRDEFILT
jgi:hypothetical protein